MTTGIKWELNHLAKDRCETNDISGKHPVRVQESFALKPES